jgi:hypothetical protein
VLTSPVTALDTSLSTVVTNTTGTTVAWAVSTVPATFTGLSDAEADKVYIAKIALEAATGYAFPATAAGVTVTAPAGVDATYASTLNLGGSDTAALFAAGKYVSRTDGTHIVVYLVYTNTGTEITLASGDATAINAALDVAGVTKVTLNYAAAVASAGHITIPEDVTLDAATSLIFNSGLKLVGAWKAESGDATLTEGTNVITLSGSDATLASATGTLTLVAGSNTLKFGDDANEIGFGNAAFASAKYAIGKKTDAIFAATGADITFSADAITGAGVTQSVLTITGDDGEINISTTGAVTLTSTTVDLATYGKIIIASGGLLTLTGASSGSAITGAGAIYPTSGNTKSVAGAGVGNADADAVGNAGKASGSWSTATGYITSTGNGSGTGTAPTGGATIVTSVVFKAYSGNSNANAANDTSDAVIVGTSSGL